MEVIRINKKNPLPYAVAKKISTSIKQQLKPLKMYEVGSLKRKSQYISDFDFITNKKLINGRKYISFIHPIPNGKKLYNVKVDIWYYPNLKIGQFIRSLDKGHLIAIHKGLKKNGYKLTNNYILDLQTKKHILFTIRKVFNLANIKYKKYY